MIPNGSGNDMCSSLGIDSPQKALDMICSKTTTKVDYGKMLVDYESEEEIPEGSNKWNHCRLFNNSIGFATVPKIAIGAKPFKTCCGTSSYKISALKLACCSTLTVEQKIYCDGKLIKPPKSKNGVISTMVVSLLNSKWYGFMISNPVGCINDGMMEMNIMTDEGQMNLGGMGRMLKDGADGISSIYRKTFAVHRGREFRVEAVGE